MAQCLKNGIINNCTLPNPDTSAGGLTHILTILFTVVGAIAFLMLIITGLRYVLSSGEPTKTAELQRQMIYIAIGLILVGSADAIVTFALNKAG